MVAAVPMPRARHVLASRLRKLEADGVLRRERYRERPRRHEYRLTEKGKALFPVLIALIDWAERHVPSGTPGPYTLVSRQTSELIEPVMVDARTGDAISPRTVRAVARSGDAA